MEDRIAACRKEILKKISALKSSDRNARKDALVVIKQELTELSILNQEEVYELLPIIHVPILTSLGDKVEKCRELSAEIMNLAVDIASNFDQLLPPLIACLVSRLASFDDSETSEEVRLLEVKTLFSIIENSSEVHLFRFLNDIVFILTKTVVDPCPEVKRVSCSCCSALAEKFPSKFHMVSGTLLPPMLQTISHQHSKTRTICIYSIGSVVLFGKSQQVEDVVSHFAQRLFDHSPSVRIAVVTVVAKWLLELSDRYSFFHRLIPLLLSSLSDDVDEVSSKAKTLWNVVGQQYLEENEKDFKGQIDFPTAVPDDYPCQDGQPNLGCKALVQRNLCNILPALLRDLEDWVAETRVKSSKLLYLLLLHAESNATSYLPKFIQGIVTAAKDEEADAVQMATHSAELLGYFIEPHLLCTTFLPVVLDSPTAAHLSILAGILRGFRKKNLGDCYESICKVLADPLVCTTRKSDEQAYLLLCIEAVLHLPNEIDTYKSQQLFNALTSVTALSSVDSIEKKGNDLIEYLAKAQLLKSRSLIFKEHTLPFLNKISVNHELWTPLSPEVAILSYLIKSCDDMQEIADIVIPVLIKNLEPEKDPKLRSIILTVVTLMLEKLPDTEEFSASTFDLMQKGIFPNLTWQVGNTASALRTIAIACLCKIISGKKFSPNMMSAVGDELFSKLASLIDEDSFQSRLLVLKIVEYILPTLVCSIDQHKIHNLIFEFLKLMDDVHNEVRLWTIKVFKSYFKSFVTEFNWNTYRAHIKEIYKIMLIHMDDNSGNIRTAVLDLLKDFSHACPDILLEECESAKPLFRSADCCEELIEHIKKIQITDKS